MDKKKSLLVIAGAVLVTGVALCGQVGPALPRFAAVSIKTQPPSYRLPRGEQIGPVRAGGKYIDEHAILWTLIAFAHPQCLIPGKTVVGLPDWAYGRPGAIFDFAAVPAAGTSPDVAQMQQMMDVVLADRFQLEYRMEHRTMPVFFLEVAPGGPQIMKASKPGQQSLLLRVGPGAILARGASLDQIAGVIGSHFEDRPVLNRTGLEGFYDIDLKPPARTLGARSGEEDNRSDIERELSALGLKLVAGRAEVPVMVVVHVSMPTPN